jgi:hypothetical protein
VFKQADADANSMYDSDDDYDNDDNTDERNSKLVHT